MILVEENNVEDSARPVSGITEYDWNDWYLAVQAVISI
jgi:hypothetical protein